MKAFITEKGIELFAESMAEGYALRYLLPPGRTAEENAAKITIHSDPETLRKQRLEPAK